MEFVVPNEKRTVRRKKGTSSSNYMKEKREKNCVKKANIGGLGRIDGSMGGVRTDRQTGRQGADMPAHGEAHKWTDGGFAKLGNIRQETKIGHTKKKTHGSNKSVPGR